MYSYLDDTDGLTSPLKQCAQQASAGVSYRINTHAELRAEYRHDFSSAAEDINSVSVHLALGF
jgi:hypothetical protein